MCFVESLAHRLDMNTQWLEMQVQKAFILIIVDLWMICANLVNLSARLMGNASKLGKRILVDEATCKSASRSIEFESLGEIVVKGKGSPVSIFYPKSRLHQQAFQTPNPKVVKIRGNYCLRD